MRNIQDTFETRNRQFINAFSISMTVPLTTFFRKRHQIYPIRSHGEQQTHVYKSLPRMC